MQSEKDTVKKETDKNNTNNTLHHNDDENDFVDADDRTDAQSNSTCASEFVDVGNEIEAIIREREQIMPHYLARNAFMSNSAGGASSSAGGGGPAGGGVGGGGSGGFSNGFGFDVPIEPLCVTTNFSGSRVAVGHTRGFVLYAVRQVDARAALAATAANNTTISDGPTIDNPFPASSAHAGISSSSPSPSPFLPIPASQLVPIVWYDEDDRLCGKNDEGLKRPFAHLRRYGMPIHSSTKGGGGSSVGSRQGTAAEEEEEEDDDDCTWGESCAFKPEGGVGGKSAAAGGPTYAGVGTIALLFETTFVGVVGGGPRPMGAPNQLHIFSGNQQTSTIKASGPIERVQMASGIADRSTQVLMLTRDQFFCIYLFDGTLRYRAPTHTLNDCLAQPLAVNSSKCFVCFPSPPKRSGGGGSGGGGHGADGGGGFEVARFADSANIRNTCSVPRAHSHPISSLAISADADVCVTCSTNGTLIRVWNVREGSDQQGTMLSELRTSPIPCRIRHIGVSSQGNYIYALVNSVNVCVFFIGKEEEAKAHDVSTKDPSRALAKNQSSYWSRFSFLTSFFESKWAVSTMGLPTAMLPATLLKGAEYYGSRGVRGGGQARTRSGAAAATAADFAGFAGVHREPGVSPSDGASATGATTAPPMPSQTSLTGGLLQRWGYGGGGGGASPATSAESPATQQTPTTTILPLPFKRAIGSGDVVTLPPEEPRPIVGNANTTATTNATSDNNNGASSSYYGGWMVNSLYGAAAKTVSYVASASGVTIGGAGSGVVVAGSASNGTNNRLLGGGGGGGDPYASSVGLASSGVYPIGAAAPNDAAAPTAAKDGNGRTADDVLALWWEQPEMVLELGRTVQWDGYDLEGYYQHAERCAAAEPSHLRRAKQKANGGGANNVVSAAALSPQQGTPSGASVTATPPPAASTSATSPQADSTATTTTAAAPIPKEYLCIVNGYGELLRVAFNPVGGSIVPMPIVPAKE